MDSNAKGNKGGRVRPTHALAVGALALVVVFSFFSLMTSSSTPSAGVLTPAWTPSAGAGMEPRLAAYEAKMTSFLTELASVKQEIADVANTVANLEQAVADGEHKSQQPAGADLSKLTLAKRTDIPNEVNVAKGAQANGDHSWSNPETKDTYMKMYNEYHRLRSGYDTCHGCRFLPALYKTYSFKSVFDAGCGTGYLVRELLKAGKDAYGVEAASLPLETYAADLLANNTVFIRPLHETPFKDAYFDFILSTEVFEHVPVADVDRSMKEMYRVAKPGAKAFVTIGMGTSRFDTKEGRMKSDVAGFDLAFKFHETVQTRKWWMDTFCANGWYEDWPAYNKFVKLMEQNGYPNTLPPRGWFPLVKAPPGSRSCPCTLPPGRKANIWCGAGRKGYAGK